MSEMIEENSSIQLFIYIYWNKQHNVTPQIKTWVFSFVCQCWRLYMSCRENLSIFTLRTIRLLLRRRCEGPTSSIIPSISDAHVWCHCVLWGYHSWDTGCDWLLLLRQSFWTAFASVGRSGRANECRLNGRWTMSVWSRRRRSRNRPSMTSHLEEIREIFRFGEFGNVQQRTTSETFLVQKVEKVDTIAP